MKSKNTLRHFLAAIGCALLTTTLHAADVTWDIAPGTIGAGDSAVTGGTGTWDTTSGNWTADAGVNNIAWVNANNDTAIFGGTTGTTTLAEAITVGGITFDIKQTISGDTLTLATGTELKSNIGNSNSTGGVISSVLSGSNGFTKTGTGWLNLTAGSSSLSGDINISAGTLYANRLALGAGNIVFTGNSNFTKVYGTNGNFTQSVTVSPGVTASMSSVTFYYNANYAGALAGDNTSAFTLSLGGNTEIQFNNTSNTFAGQLTVAGGGTADNGGRGVFKSLADSFQNIIINNALFRLANGGVAMNFANRPLEIKQAARLDNDSTNAAVTMTFSQNLTATIGNNARTLILSGVNTGDNAFGGVIADSATGTGKVSVTKQEAGTWILGGVNEYTGATTVSGGALTLGVDDCLADASNVVIGNGTLNLSDGVNDTAGTLDVTNAASRINLGSGTTMAFADSSAVDWTGGALDITGTFAEASSLRFGTDANGLLPGQLALITLNGSPTSFSLDSSGYLVTGAPIDPYTAWSGGAAFGNDANGDGVTNGLAFLLGAPGPNVSALDKLPKVTETGGGLVLTFSSLNDASNGNATLALEHSSDLGISDAWTTVLVPNTTPDPQASDVAFTITPNGNLNDVVATISSTEAAAGKLFGRLKATE